MMKTLFAVVTVGMLSVAMGCGINGIDPSTSKLDTKADKQAPADPTAPCEAQGGSCVAVYPGTCATGHSTGADACGGGLGVFCCVPGTPAPDACTPLPVPSGSVNPASAYCANLGYTLSDGNCALPDGTVCDEWAFYRGECGQASSFCNLHGGQVASETQDHGSWTGIAAVCTLPSGARCDEQAFATSCLCAQ